MSPGSTYFLYGYFGAGNFGDDILLYAAIKNILERDPDARFFVRNHGPLGFPGVFGDRVTCTDIEEIHRTGAPHAVKFFRLLKAYCHYMGRSTHLVVGGGTLIHDAPYLQSTALLLCLCLIARMRRRRVIGIGLGMKTIQTRTGKILVRLLIPCFHALCLRDAQSFGQSRALCPAAKNLVLTTDLAYALDWKTAPMVQDKIIAVTLVDYMFDHSQNQTILPILADVLTDFIEQGYGIRLMALQKENAELQTAGDIRILKQLSSLLPEPHRSQCRIVALEPTPQSITDAFSGVGLMLGMRFHSLVFSALCGIPFAGLGHEPKIGAICDEFGMICLTLADLDKAALVRALQAGLSKTVDPGRIRLYQTLAKDNFSYLGGQ